MNDVNKSLCSTWDKLNLRTPRLWWLLARGRCRRSSVLKLTINESLFLFLLRSKNILPACGTRCFLCHWWTSLLQKLQKMTEKGIERQKKLLIAIVFTWLTVGNGRKEMRWLYEYLCSWSLFQGPFLIFHIFCLLQWSLTWTTRGHMYCNPGGFVGTQDCNMSRTVEVPYNNNVIAKSSLSEAMVIRCIVNVSIAKLDHWVHLRSATVPVCVYVYVCVTTFHSHSCSHWCFKSSSTRSTD